MKTIYYQHWWESESGWGQRPDGYSMHLSVEIVNIEMGQD